MKKQNAAAIMGLAADVKYTHVAGAQENAQPVQTRSGGPIGELRSQKYQGIY